MKLQYLNIFLPWTNSQRGVCDYSYFTLVTSVEEMMRIGIRFIRVVKTETTEHLMEYLSSIELNEGRGQQVVVVLKSNGLPTMMAYVWMDRNRRCFISTASSRIPWRKAELPEEEFGGASNEEAVRQEFTVS